MGWQDGAFLAIAIAFVAVLLGAEVAGMIATGKGYQPGALLAIAYVVEMIVAIVFLVLWILDRDDRPRNF